MPHGVTKSLRRITPLLAVVVACDQQPSASELRMAPRVASFVTGAAASALRPNGEFLLDRAESPDGTPIISEKRAGDLAMAYVRSFARSYHGAWSRQRGSPIDLTTLAVGPRIYFAHTPYGAFPSGFHPALRRVYGPYYLVTLESNGAPVIMMAVSAYNTDVDIDSRGQIELPRLNGMGFIHMGIPVSASRYRLLSPEEAVSTAFESAHVRVTNPPQLVLIGHRASPLLAVWKLNLEHDVPTKVRGGNAERAIRTIMVSPRMKDRFQRADEAQPSTDAGSGPRVTADGMLGAVAPFVVTIPSGRNVKFNTVELGGQ